MACCGLSWLGGRTNEGLGLLWRAKAVEEGMVEACLASVSQGWPGQGAAVSAVASYFTNKDANRVPIGLPSPVHGSGPTRAAYFPLFPETIS